ncbi:unnamed protein product [Dovyalis caffra]|uniref:DUF3741 domain-containing protein n=1 Tax=Dovyalis caffra TaxID=77055 RepID=A0AAV1RKI6_9ROSI|nr:unnamed protein product [Dovyalis caffra]
MGKEWYYWGGGKTSKKGGGGGGEGGREREKDNANLGCMCAVFQLFDFHQFQFPLNHPQQSSNFLQPNSFLRLEDPPIPKGVEAPRNSLELEEEPSLASSKDENFNIPMGIQIKTKGVPNIDSSSSEISSSPGTKTPNLVARLMGLDLLPDHLPYSPSHSSSSTLGTPKLPPKSHFQHQRCRPQQPPHHSKRSSPRSCTLDHDFSGTRSLPETPRISSARRSDVEHRLSLQINKENVGEDLVLSRFSSLKRKELKVEEENRSPGRYARQIAKQVKESVGRKVGLDITNTVRNREQTRRRDQELELVSQYKSKKILSKALSTTKIVDVSANSPGKHSVTTTSCSSRLKFLEPKNKPITTLPFKDHNNISHSQKPPPPPPLLSQITKPSTNPNLPQVLQDQFQHQHRHQQRPFKKCKKVTEEKFGPPPSRIIKKPPKTSDIIRTKQGEPFVRSTSASITNIPDKKCKKTPLSNDLNISLPILLPVKKDPTPPATKIPQKQVSNAAQESKWSSQLSSCSSQSYKQPQAMPRLDARENNNEDRSNNGVAANTITTGDGAAKEEYEYLTRILKRTGIDKDTPVSFTRWFSPSHPLDPSTFYYLEHFTTPGSITTYQNRTLDRRCNRKLLFSLVDEILVGILRPYINMKPWSSSTRFGLVPQYDRISHMNGSHLVHMLCTKIRSFPCADCHDLEDIDGLIGKDLPQLMKDQSEVAFGEEGEGIVMEIEKEIPYINLKLSRDSFRSHGQKLVLNAIRNDNGSNTKRILPDIPKSSYHMIYKAKFMPDYPQINMLRSRYYTWDVLIPCYAKEQQVFKVFVDISVIRTGLRAVTGLWIDRSDRNRPQLNISAS